MNYEYFSLFLIFQDKPDKRKNMGTQGLGYKSKCEGKSSKDESKEEETDSPNSPIPFEVRTDLPDFKKMLEESGKSVRTRKRRRRNVVEESHEERTSDHTPVSK